MAACYIGIDVSKDSSTAQGLDGKGNKLFYLEFATTAEGFTQLMRTVRTHSKDLSNAKAAKEPTGCYHTNLFCFLVSEGLPCYVINPLLTANFSKLSLRKTKTDKKDALLIAPFLLVHKDALAKAEPSHNLQDLKDLAREKESLTVVISGLKNDIKRMLQITFPELEKRCHVFSESMRDFLKQFPSARLIGAMDPRVLQQALSYYDGRKVAPFYAEDLVAEAQKSVASDSIAKELIIPEKIAALEHLMEKLDKIAKALVVACETLMIEDIEIITSIGGIGQYHGRGLSC